MRPLFLLLLAPMACCACGRPSLLLPSSDPAFARAQERLKSTTHAVEGLAPPEDERALFLQAEGYYQYRFSFPARSTLGYLAEGAAAVTDFPAFQSLASNLDLADLRISSYDGSIQLWESLLAEHPRTALKPLALYRLGWAYRMTEVRGFPRKSGQEAFEELIREEPDSPLATLAREAEKVPWKSKARATTLSLLPGMGQLYEGRAWNGSVRFGIGLASLTMVVVPAAQAYQRSSELTWSHDWPLLATGFLGAVFLSIDYTAAYQDAVKGAVIFNEAREEDFDERHPDAP